MGNQIERRTRANGSTAYRVRWSDEAGRHTRTFDTEAAAAAFLADVAARKARGTYTPPSPVTVAEVLDRYLDHHETRLAPATVKLYRHHAKVRILPALGRTPADRLTTPQVQRWLDSLRGTAAPGTIRISRAVLSSALAHAVRLGVIANNPAQHTWLPMGEGKKITTWTEPQVRAVFDAVTEPLWQAVYSLALTAGLRPGELRALQWADVDEAGCRIHVRRTVADSEAGRYVKAGTKRGKGRVVRLAPEVMRLVLALPRTGPYVFGGADYLRQWGWIREHKRICQAAGVPVIRLHDLRHTCATLMMERGVHPRVVADVLGHSGVTITLDRYSHPSDTWQGTAADAMRALLDED